MTQNTLREFSAPSTENIHVEPTLDTNDREFELKPSLINMVQANTFSGKAYEDVSAHLQNFLEICSTVVIKETFLKMSYYFVCFCSHWREERSSGSTPIKIKVIHGQDVLKLS
jgi:hypothetical protein